MRSAQLNARTSQPIPARARPAERNAYLDLLRVLAICAVVTGHWLLTNVTNRGGRLSGDSALPYVSWSGWATLLFQVMPTFFLVGGYVDAISWARHHGAGASWTGWVQGRALRLLWPAAVYLAVMTAATGSAAAAGVSPATVATIGWALAYQLWFLPVYLLLIALTPAMLAAHRRWGPRIPAAMAVAAAAIDIAVVGGHVPALGHLNYFLVWGSMYQWGFAWQSGWLSGNWRRALGFAAAGAAALAALLAWSPFPVDMIGNGQRIGNTTPPSIALLAFAAAQAGLVIAAEPLASRLLARAGWSRVIERLNAQVMFVYLWHLVPVVLVGVALYPAGLLPQPAPGSLAWWQWRPAWLAALWITLLALLPALAWLHRPLRLLPPGLGRVRTWSPALLTAGLAAAMFALTSLAKSGFAPAGALPVLALAAFSAGLILVLWSGRVPGTSHVSRELSRT